MKLLLVLIVWVLAGCAVVDPGIPSLGLRSVEEVMRWVSEWVTYQSDMEQYGVLDHWALPQATYDSRLGDCDDFTILALYLLDTELGMAGWMTVGNVPGFPPHGWVYVNGEDWSAETGERVDPANYVNRERITYTAVMLRAVMFPDGVTAID